MALAFSRVFTDIPCFSHTPVTEGLQYYSYFIDGETEAEQLSNSVKATEEACVRALSESMGYNPAFRLRLLIPHTQMQTNKNAYFQKIRPRFISVGV